MTTAEQRDRRKVATVKWRKAHPEQYNENRRQQKIRRRAEEREEMLVGRRLRVSGQRASQIRTSAKRRGKVFAIDGLVLRVPERCPLAGIPLDGRDRDHTPSIDRIDNEGDYTPGNVWVVSVFANRVKFKASVEVAKRRLARLQAANDNAPSPEEKAA